jgi:DNA-directed RNA polymerase subunit RPC12/RpoP
MDRPDYIPRMDFDEQQFERLVNAGIAAIKSNERKVARTLLLKATEMKTTDPRPWLWLSATTDDPEEQRNYLEYALAADPGNGSARRGLVLLSGKLDKSRLLAEGEQVLPRQPSEPEDATTNQVFLCSNCGGRLNFEPGQESVVCEFCCSIQHFEGKKAADSAEQVLDFVLPTTRGHRGAEAQHRLSCSQCGAVLILAVAEKSNQCPYCGSRQLIESVETGELIDPQVIGLAKLNTQKAIQYLKNWLDKGLFTPDDLKNLARPSFLRPAYYPFWTFDGTCEMHWSCEVNSGIGSYPDWNIREGVECEMFDDIMVSGLHNLSRKQLAEIEPFQLKEVVEFEPECLAGWNVLAYDIPLSDASLTAREIVARKLRRTLYQRVRIELQKRNLQAGAIEWSGLTFKHVLLPLWVGTYHYREQNYRILINGQTGKISGEKPRDRIKVAAFMVVVIAAIMLILLLCLGLTMAFGPISSAWFTSYLNL